MGRAKKNGARQFRVTGTFTGNTTGDTSSTSSMASGILNTYDLQIRNDVYNWVAVTASGNYQRSQHTTTQVTASRW